MSPVLKTDERVIFVDKITLFSPAKVNLFFNVVRKRDDQYHDIISLNQTISLGDHLTFRKAQKDSLSCNDKQIPLDEKNLIWKAVSLFREKTGLFFPLSIHLEKQIPVEAGLGGGSSNAATTLQALRVMTGRSDITDTTCASWSSALGMDVPFFFSSGTALCHERGDRFKSLLSLPSPSSFWIAKPYFGLKTQEVYQAVFPQPSSIDSQQLLNRIYLGDTTRFFNDLEGAAFKILPALDHYKTQLLHLFDHVVMTGSGSAFLCFGKKGKSLMLEGTTFYSAHYVQRSQGTWY